MNKHGHGPIDFSDKTLSYSLREGFSAQKMDDAGTWFLYIGPMQFFIRRVLIWNILFEFLGLGNVAIFFFVLPLNVWLFILRKLHVIKMNNRSIMAVICSRVYDTIYIGGIIFTVHLHENNPEWEGILGNIIVDIDAFWSPFNVLCEDQVIDTFL